MSRPTSGPIEPILRIKQHVRHEFRLPLFWEKSSLEVVSKPEHLLQRYSHCEIQSGSFFYLPACEHSPASELFAQSAPLYLMLSDPCPDEAIHILQQALMHNKPVYVLASQEWAAGQSEKLLQEYSQARVLIRIAPSVPVSALLASRGQNAGMWLGPNTKAPRWWLSVSEEQGADLFQAFLYLFWHCAEQEAWTEMGQPLDFTEAKTRPFDVPLLTRNDRLQLWEKDRFIVPSHLSGGYDPEGRLTKDSFSSSGVLLQPPLTTDMELWLPFIQNGNALCWENLDLPMFFWSQEEASLLIPSHDSWTLEIRLNASQKHELEFLVSAACHSNVWQLRHDIPLGEIEGEVLLPGASKLQKIIKQTTVSVEDVSSSTLYKMELCEPETWPKPPQLALSFQYEWIVNPVYVPAQAKRAKLHHNWEKLDAHVETRLDSISKELEQQEEYSKSLGHKFLALTKAVLGFSKKNLELHTEWQELSQKTPSKIGPDDAQKMLLELQKLEERLHDHNKKMSDAEVEQKRKLEEEKQQNEWEERRQKEEQRRPSLQQDIVELEDALEDLMTMKDDLSSQMSEAEKKERKKLKKDIQAKESRIRNVENKRNRLLDELRLLDAFLEKEFVFNPPSEPKLLRSSSKKIKGARFVPKVSSEVGQTVPHESLPSVGILFEHKKERFLVIELWEELEEGMLEAERLGAKLVTSRR